MSPISFDTADNVAFNEDPAVVFHEVGHALVWYAFGGGVGRLRFHRAEDQLLEPGVCLRPRRRDDSPSVTWQQMPKELASRFLAGEAAARRFLGMSRTEICSKGLDLRSTTCLASTLQGHEDDREDIVKALFLALDCAGREWHNWIAERHVTANSIIDAGWKAIQAAAESILPHLPDRPGDTWSTPGLTLIGTFERLGVTTRIKPAVEIVCAGDEGSTIMRMCRLYRTRLARSLRSWTAECRDTG